MVRQERNEKQGINENHWGVKYQAVNQKVAHHQLNSSKNQFFSPGKDP